MNEILNVFLSMSIAGSMLGLVVLLLRVLLKKHVSRNWQYFIWLVVIVRLLVPFTPQISLYSIVSHTVLQNIPAEASDFTYESNYTQASQPEINNVNETNSDIQTKKTSFDLIKYMWLILPLGSLIFALYKTFAYLTFMRNIKVGRVPITKANVLNEYANTIETCKLKKAPKLYYSSYINTPMLVGCFKSAIILPQKVKGNLNHIFLHELIHYKRHDILYKFLVQCTLCLHWFNPLIWLFAKQIEKDCELSCDESAINITDKIGYGHTLIAGLTKKDFSSHNAMSLSGNGRLLKERLDNIMKYTKEKSRKARMLTIAVSVFVISFALFTGCATVKAMASDIDDWLNINSESLETTTLAKFDKVLLDNFEDAQEALKNYTKIDTESVKDLSFCISMVESEALYKEYTDTSFSMAIGDHIKGTGIDSINLSYTLKWHVPDMAKSTIKERNEIILNFYDSMKEIIETQVNNGAFDKIDSNDQAQIFNVVSEDIKNAAKKLSTDAIQLTVEEDAYMSSIMQKNDNSVGIYMCLDRNSFTTDDKITY